LRLGLRPNGRKIGKRRINGKRVVDRLVIQMADGAVRFGRVFVRMPNGAQRCGKDHGQDRQADQKSRICFRLGTLISGTERPIY
jgi:hypothetical protein